MRISYSRWPGASLNELSKKPSSLLNVPWKTRSAFGLVLLSLNACAGQSAHAHSQDQTTHHAQAEMSDPDVPLDATDEPPTSSAPGSSAAQLSSEKAQPSLAAASAEPDAPPKEAPIAKAALRRIPSVDNHLELALVLVERVSDLPWVLALENRSAHDVTIAALPELIQFEVTPPASASATASASETAPGAAAVTCGSTPPKSVDPGATVTIPAGGMLVHAFDPRPVCQDPAVLSAGATVRLTFGFPLPTKKLWKNGKMTEVPAEPKAPYLAERVVSGTEPVAGLKQLVIEPFVLGRTYPLDKLSARPEEDPAQAAPSTNPEAPASLAEAPKEPLQVQIFPLGTAEKPENGLVRVQVKNVSDKTLWIHMRREAFTYEVVGPHGSSTCQMNPKELSASGLSYSSLAPGASTSLSTRLAEACPPGVWSEPGTYTVAVKFSPTSSGEEKKEGAFVGTIAGSQSATLIVPGKTTTRRTHMLVVAR